MPRRVAGADWMTIVAGMALVALMVVWAAHNGGFDADTWYWGALSALALLGVVLVLPHSSARSLPRATKVAIVAFALYVAWSYLSITWAQAPGVALAGSNKALLYLIIFSLFTLLPWQAATARLALLAFALSIGTIATVFLFRLASTGDGASLIVFDRLSPPIGYFNGNAALFTMGALVMVGLSLRRELPGPVRGLLLAMAGAGLQLAVVAQSRGWLFTLPVVMLVAVAISPDRLRFLAALVLPVVAALIPLRKLLNIYSAPAGRSLTDAVHAAGRPALVIVGIVFVVGTILAWLDQLAPRGGLRPVWRGTIGTAVAVVVAAAVVAGGTAATHGHPFSYISRQWNGFSHTQTYNRGSHFSDVGSGRYDFWRVALHAFTSHPIGGLGQDNFADYYVVHRRTSEEPAWTHSLEIRLLTHTGAVGFVLFSLFLIAAIVPAIRARRHGLSGARQMAGLALMPLTVWLVHGSIDWFWELPALSGPALGFLGMAGALARQPSEIAAGQPSEIAASRPPSDAAARQPSATTAPARMPVLRHPVARAARVVLGAAVLVAATLVLTIPYLSVREVSVASDVINTNPRAALHDLAVAADLNPLNADAGTRAGLLALSDGENAVAKQRFAQSIDREPGAWLAWWGTGLADSGLGKRRQAAFALRRAYTMNNQQPPVLAALKRVFSPHPLTYAEAIPLFVIVR